MKLLVLGGSLFVGRHVVEAALERGYEVTLFNRGRTNASLFPGAEHLVGDRDGDLSMLAARTWDAVVDTSGYVPRIVRSSAELLAGSGHYTFVSSISAYRDFIEIGINEEHPLAALPEDSEDVDRFYGALKALSEDVVRSVFAERALIVRAGLIVGPYDWTNRFGWWMQRVARGGDLLVPDVSDRWLVQIVHGRDLAEWMLDMAERGAGGTFNATSAPFPMEGALAAAAAVAGVEIDFVRVDEDWLVGQGVEPFEELPLWLASGRHPEFRGFFAVDVSRALAAGLVHRPISETVADALAWQGDVVKKDYGPTALARRLDSRKERELLDAWATLEEKRERLDGR